MRLSIYLLFVLPIVQIGCDPHDGKLILTNKTNDTVFYVFSINDNGFTLPINKHNDVIDFQNSNLILPNSNSYEPMMDSWEHFIQNKCEDGILRVYFFNLELIESTGIDSVLKNQLHSKKMKLRVKDLEKLNWQISYDN